MSKIYQNYMNILKNWPVVEWKGGRDYGRKLRDLMAGKFPHGYVFGETEAENQKRVNSLTRLSNNQYSNLYMVKERFSATGLTPSQCHQLLGKSYKKIERLNSEELQDVSDKSLTISNLPKQITEKQVEA